MIIDMKTSRRSFFRKSVGGAAVLATHHPFSIGVMGANSRLNMASVGVGGKGWSDLLETSKGQNVVAVCDVDDRELDRASARFPGAKRHQDWRRLLEHSDIEAITVSTPDHMHAPISMAAIRQGKHVYCQKPLTHDVYEARQLARAAEEFGVVTQMGTQHHSGTYFKTTVKLIQDGVIGRVQKAHVWTDRPVGFWEQGGGRPRGAHPVPDGLAWDQWLGTAPDRPYVPKVYHRFHWRGYWDFGTGALGDMGCHGINPVYNALQLGAPTQVEVTHSPVSQEMPPEWSIITYRFPGTPFTRGSLDLVWWDGMKHPPLETLKAPAGFEMTKNGILFVGEKGNLYVEYDRGPYLWPEENFRGHVIESEPAANHYMQWTNACRGEGTATCPFSYAGPLTEAVLLGNVALRLGRSIQWDSAALRVPGDPEAAPFIRREYRRGWEVEGL